MHPPGFSEAVGDVAEVGGDGMVGETEEEAMMTLNFIKEMKWVHFPYMHIVRILPGTDLEKFALNHGIPRKAISESIDKSYHQVTPTLPFSKDFTKPVFSESARVVRASSPKNART